MTLCITYNLRTFEVGTSREIMKIAIPPPPAFFFFFNKAFSWCRMLALTLH